jgi:hypothetical protein
MWVKFTGEFAFRPPEKPKVKILFKPGTLAFVRRICAFDAIARGRAVPAKRPACPAR